MPTPTGLSHPGPYAVVAELVDGGGQLRLEEHEAQRVLVRLDLRVAPEALLVDDRLHAGDGVVVEAEGDPPALAAFVARLSTDAPPLALVVGDPSDPRTDVGPVIDRPSFDKLMGRREAMKDRIAKTIPAQAEGLFVPPTLIRLDAIEDLTEEEI